MGQDLTLISTLESFLKEFTFEADKDLDQNEIESSRLRRLLQVMMSPQRKLIEKSSK